MSIEKEIEELKIINQQMAEKIKQLESQNKKEKELNKYKLPRKPNERYYYIDKFTTGIDIDSAIDHFNNILFNNLYNDTNYNEYNYFTDENKAQKYVDHIKLELELLQIRDMINEDWKPVWNFNSKTKYSIINAENKVELVTRSYSYVPFAFEIPEKRNKFIELVGEDKIIKYLSF